jgi:hypothetical protein
MITKKTYATRMKKRVSEILELIDTAPDSSDTGENTKDYYCGYLEGLLDSTSIFKGEVKK